MVSPRQANNDALKRVFKEIFDLEDDSNLHKACEYEGIDNIPSLLTLTPCDINDLTYLDDNNNKSIINHGHRELVLALKALWSKRHADGNPITIDCSNVDIYEFDSFRGDKITNTPRKQANILKHVLENVILDDSDSPLAFALQQHGCHSILDVLALSPWEIETLTWTDGSKPRATVPRGCRSQVVALQAFVMSLHPSPNSMTAKDWLALTADQFFGFQRSGSYMLLRQQSPRPQPPRDTTKNGEHNQNWGALDLFEPFDVDEFEAAMLHSNKPPSCLPEEEDKPPNCLPEEEDTTTKDDSVIEVLENAILFFEVFCVEDDFETDVMEVESKVPSTAIVEPVPFVTTSDTNSNYPCHTPADTTVYVEYPDRTKFVSSMNHEQYEELETTYNDLDFCPMVCSMARTAAIVCDACTNHSRCWGVTEFP